MSSLLFVSYIKILSTSSKCVFISVIYSWSVFIYSCSRLITLCSYFQDALHFYIFENFKHTYFKCRMLSYLYFVICEFLYTNLLTLSHGKDFLMCFIIFQSSIHLSKVSQFQRWYFYQHLQHLSWSHGGRADSFSSRCCLASLRYWWEWILNPFCPCCCVC